MSQNNPFQCETINRSNPFVPAGTYQMRVISMKCWTKAKDGDDHPLPSMGLILGMLDDDRQVRVNLICPQSAESHQRYSKKVGAILQALKMEPSSFYDVEGHKSSPVLDNRGHPENPVGKLLTLRISPEMYACKHEKDGFWITMKQYNLLCPDRSIRNNELWKKIDVEDGSSSPVLHRLTGRHSVIRVH